MIDKLEWDKGAIELMKYIGIVESIYLPDFEEYDYNLNVSFCEASQEAIDEARNIPFGATTSMIIFRDRYNKELLTNQHRYDKYIKDESIQQLIRGFELDKDKFWLLILFVLDYCESMFFQGTTMKLNPIEQLQQLVTMIDKSEDDAMTLKFKAGKLKAIVDDPHALRFIANAIEKYVSEADMETAKYLSRRIEADESEILKDSPFIAFFANSLLRFFDRQPQIRSSRKEGARHSLKEMELVSMLVYFTKLSTNDKWLDIESEFLKGYLKQYRGYQYPQNVSRVYPEFFY